MLKVVSIPIIPKGEIWNAGGSTSENAWVYHLPKMHFWFYKRGMTAVT